MISSNSTDSIFDSLGHPVRRRFLEVLFGLKPHYQGNKRNLNLTATELAELAPELTFPAVSQHLARLRVSGWVIARREGRNVYYSARPEALQEALGWILPISESWTARMERNQPAESK